MALNLHLKYLKDLHGNTTFVISPQGNGGKAKSEVKTAKLLIKKATDDNADAFLELLAHHNPPQKNFDKSPAQRMFAVAAGRPYLPFLYYYSST